MHVYIYGVAWEVEVGSDWKEFEASFEGTSHVLFPDQDAGCTGIFVYENWS